VIPNGIDEAAWQVERRPDVLRQRCGPKAGDRPIILFLSRLHPKKGIVDYLLPAYARLKTDAFLAIAGGPDEHEPGYARRVLAEVERLGVTDRVALLGTVPPEERWWLYDGAAVFILPSHSENFGVVVIEAMARGVPVVVSDAVQAGEHVRRAEAGEVAPLRMDSITTSLEKLLARENGVAMMGERGRAYVREHLDWHAIAGRLARAYQS
jgi:glycosyltransferase involved in cell wall biosynthesis